MSRRPSTSSSRRPSNASSVNSKGMGGVANIVPLPPAPRQPSLLRHKSKSSNSSMKPGIGERNTGANLREVMEVVNEMNTGAPVIQKVLRSKSLRGGTNGGLKVNSSNDVRVRARKLSIHEFPNTDARSRAMELLSESSAVLADYPSGIDGINSGDTRERRESTHTRAGIIPRVQDDFEGLHWLLHRISVHSRSFCKHVKRLHEMRENKDFESRREVKHLVSCSLQQYIEEYHDLLDENELEDAAREFQFGDMTQRSNAQIFTVNSELTPLTSRVSSHRSGGLNRGLSFVLDNVEEGLNDSNGGEIRAIRSDILVNVSKVAERGKKLWGPLAKIYASAMWTDTHENVYQEYRRTRVALSHVKSFASPSVMMANFLCMQDFRIAHEQASRKELINRHKRGLKPGDLKTAQWMEMETPREDENEADVHDNIDYFLGGAAAAEAKAAAALETKAEAAKLEASKAQAAADALLANTNESSSEGGVEKSGSFTKNGKPKLEIIRGAARSSVMMSRGDLTAMWSPSPALTHNPFIASAQDDAITASRLSTIAGNNSTINNNILERKQTQRYSTLERGTTTTTPATSATTTAGNLAHSVNNSQNTHAHGESNTKLARALDKVAEQQLREWQYQKEMSRGVVLSSSPTQASAWNSNNFNNIINPKVTVSNLGLTRDEEETAKREIATFIVAQHERQVKRFMHARELFLKKRMAKQKVMLTKFHAKVERGSGLQKRRVKFKHELVRTKRRLHRLDVKYQNMTAPEVNCASSDNRPPPGSLELPDTDRNNASSSRNTSFKRSQSTRTDKPDNISGTSSFRQSVTGKNEENDSNEDNKGDDTQVEKQKGLDKLKKKFGIDQRGIDVSRTQDMAMEYCRTVHERGGGWKLPRGTRAKMLLKNTLLMQRVFRGHVGRLYAWALRWLSDTSHLEHIFKRHKTTPSDDGINDPLKLGYLLKELDRSLVIEEVQALWENLSHGDVYVDPKTISNSEQVCDSRREGSRASTSSTGSSYETGYTVKFEAFLSYWMQTRSRDFSVMDMLRLSQVVKAQRKKLIAEQRTQRHNKGRNQRVFVSLGKKGSGTVTQTRGNINMSKPPTEQKKQHNNNTTRYAVGTPKPKTKSSRQRPQSAPARRRQQGGSHNKASDGDDEELARKRYARQSAQEYLQMRRIRREKQEIMRNQQTFGGSDGKRELSLQEKLELMGLPMSSLTPKKEGRNNVNNINSEPNTNLKHERSYSPTHALLHKKIPTSAFDIPQTADEFELDRLTETGKNKKKKKIKKKKFTTRPQSALLEQSTEVRKQIKARNEENKALFVQLKNSRTQLHSASQELWRDKQAALRHVLRVIRESSSVIDAVASGNGYIERGGDNGFPSGNGSITTSNRLGGSTDLRESAAQMFVARQRANRNERVESNQDSRLSVVEVFSLDEYREYSNVAKNLTIQGAEKSRKKVGREETKMAAHIKSLQNKNDPGHPKSEYWREKMRVQDKTSQNKVLPVDVLGDRKVVRSTRQFLEHKQKQLEEAHVELRGMIKKDERRSIARGSSGGMLDVLSQVDRVLLLLNAEADRFPRED